MFLQRRYTNDQQADENMLLGNSNKNDNETSIRMAKIKKKQH